MHIFSQNIYATLLLFICYNLRQATSNYHDNRGPGWVVPSIVNNRIGATFNISCTINQTFLKQNNLRCNVDELYFHLAETGEKLTNVYITNATTITYTVKNAVEQRSTYRCMCGSNAVLEAKVFIGTEPLLVKDFNCNGYDYQYMVCKFTMPENKLLTTYNVSYVTKDNLSYKYYIDCSNEPNYTVACNITDEKYRQFESNFEFKIVISNALKTIEQSISINNFERTIPSRPGDFLRVVNSTRDSICLCWEMPRRSNYVKKGLLWDVMVVPLNFSALHRESWRNSSHGIYITLCLDDLLYVGYEYKLQLRVRVNASGSVWSEPYTETFQTKPDRPSRPPNVASGSYYVYSSDTELRLYWEELKQYEYNGVDFGYVISEYKKNGEKMDPSSIIVNTSSALIKNWEKSAHYEIFIRSRNNVNVSIEASRMEIMPSTDVEFKERMPQNIRGIFQPTNRSYTLSWVAPERETDVINYTVYWCQAKRGLQVECDGSIHFVNVSRNARSFTTDPAQNEWLNMAVSANFERYNTGMHWHVCTRTITSDLARMEPFIENVTNSSFIIKWSTERVCESILVAYNLTYCEIGDNQSNEKIVTNATEDNIYDDSNTDPKCHNKQIDKYSKSYEIRGLKPYTNYTVKMLMYSKTTSSKYSDEIPVLTGQAAPSSPRRLYCTHVTNTTATLSWLPPTITNGPIRRYIISINDINKYYNYDINSVENSITYKLYNLTAYTPYKVTVRASTLYDSEPSTPVHFMTAVSAPSKPSLNSKDKNGNTILFWSPPENPAGPISYYEVAINEFNANNTLIRRKVSHVLGNKNLTCQIRTPNCTPLHQFIYEVRAINVELNSNSEMETLQNESQSRQEQEQQSSIANYGSQDEELHCVSRALQPDDASLLKNYSNSRMYRQHISNWDTRPIKCSPTTLSLASSIMPVIAIMIATVFVIHFGRKRYKKMANIQCTLPAGIDPYTKHASSIGGMSMPGENNDVRTFVNNPQMGYVDPTKNDHLDCNFSQLMSDTQLVDTTGHGNESAKLLRSAAKLTGACGINYNEEPEDGSNCTNASSGSSYMRMNSGSTTETLLDTVAVNNFDDTNLFEATPVKSAMSEYKNATDFMNSNGIESQATVPAVAGGYIKPGNMINLWNSTTHGGVGVTNANSSRPAASQIPASGYISVQNLPSAQSSFSHKPNSFALETVQPKTVALATVPLTNNGYVQAADLQKLAPNNGYVQAADLQKLTPNNGYVQAADLQKLASASAQTAPMTATLFNNSAAPAVKPLINASGYTTMEQLENARTNANIMPFSSNGGTNPNGLGPQTDQSRPIQPPISGYVTQRDLNAFAKQQQQQQQHHHHQSQPQQQQVL